MGYNSSGYQTTISAGGSTRYTITSMNAREQLTGSTYGSSLTGTYGFDAYGYPTSTTTGTVQSYRYVFDPITGNLTFTQNYNRYTYCLNNPLKYVDPSGWQMCYGGWDMGHSPTNIIDFSGHTGERDSYSGRGGGGWGGVIPDGYTTMSDSLLTKF